MKRVLFASLLWSSAALLAVEASYGIRKDHLQKTLGDGVYVDWTAGYISVSADHKIEDVRAGGGLTRVRDDATQKAREKALSRLMQIVSTLPIHGHDTIESKLESDESLQNRMGMLASLPFEKARRVGDGSVSVELILPFYGRRGLLSRVYSGEESEMAELVHENPEDPITGIVVDATEASSDPVLEPRILTDQGRLIYGPGIARRGCYVSRGMAAYYTSREAARKDKRVGENPYLVYARGRKTPGDLFISSQDSVRILGSKSGRDALRKCAVTIVVSK